MKIIEGGITAAKGFKAFGLHAGLKKKRKDLALVVSEAPALYSGTFTTNVVKAAPVLWNMEIYKHKYPVSAVVINSGNANACTGQQGVIDNEAMAEAVASGLRLTKDNVLVGSTGVIGVELPIKKVIEGIDMIMDKVKTSIIINWRAYEKSNTWRTGRAVSDWNDFLFICGDHRG